MMEKEKEEEGEEERVGVLLLLLFLLLLLLLILPTLTNINKLLCPPTPRSIRGIHNHHTRNV